MMLKLSELLPNPRRDFTIDPINEEAVAALVASIKEDGFWGGVVCRRNAEGNYEIACGHHRVKAAILSGITHADLTVGDYDNRAMIRIYARENATQRGNHSSALAGSVGSAIHFIAHALLSGDVSGIPETSPKAIEILKGQLKSDKGLGEPTITRFLEGVPGINKNVVSEQLVGLKSSGEYARILTEVDAEIAAEVEAEQERIRQQEMEEEERQRQMEEQQQKKDDSAKAKAKAEEKEVTFDRAGCAVYFTVPSHLDAFRKQVTGKGVRPYLTVENQPAVAAALVAKAKEEGRELNAGYIREYIYRAILEVKTKEQEMKAKEREEMMRRSAIAKAEKYQADFARSCRGMSSAGTKISALLKEWDQSIPFPITGEFREALRHANIVISKLAKEAKI